MQQEPFEFFILVKKANTFYYKELIECEGRFRANFNSASFISLDKRTPQLGFGISLGALKNYNVLPINEYAKRLKQMACACKKNS